MLARVLVLNTLAPVFLLITVGALLQRGSVFSAGFLKEANRLTYLVGLPALLFSELARSFHGIAIAGGMLETAAIVTALAIGVAYLAARTLRVPGPAVGTLVQGAFRGNLAFVGLPVIFAMPEVTLPGGVSSRVAAVVVIAPMMVVYNFMAIVVLLLSQHRLGWAMLRPFLRQLLTTPPLIAILAGIGVGLAGWTLPAAVDKAFVALGEMALPLGLLGVGGSLVTVPRGAGGSAAWGAALIKTTLAPAFAWAVAHTLGLGALETKIVMIFMATPTAIVSYPFALELKGDEAIAAGTIVRSTLLSIATLAVVVGFF